MEYSNLLMGDACRFRVLDECDEMLNMGFADDVEAILASALDSATVQTMLFSATMPSWVKGVQAKYLRQGKTLNVDLVGNDVMKASRSVAHKILYAHWSQRANIIRDLVACYGFSGAPLPHLLASRLRWLCMGTAGRCCKATPDIWTTKGRLGPGLR
jgi:ATP-dependent RNA helicase DDX21